MLLSLPFFSSVFTDVLPTGEANLSGWKNKLFGNKKKADQRGEELSDGGCQLEEEVKANVQLIEEAIFVQLRVHKIKSRTHFPHICSFHKLSEVVIFQPTYWSSILIYKTCINLYNRKGTTQARRNWFAYKKG